MTGFSTPPDWIEERPYQTDAIASWINADARGILEMATGTGKTVTALLAASRVADANDGQLALVIAAPYQHLVDQWVEDLRDFDVVPILAYKSRDTWVDQYSQAISDLKADVRDTLVIVTTHKTFATEHFQELTAKLPGNGTMLIADEVHHMGAPHLREHLPSTIDFRLGLSATPERWYDEEGTEALNEYFGEIVFEYGLEAAIEDGALCKYYYIPHLVELTDDEADTYIELSKEIAQKIQEGGGINAVSFDENTRLKQLFLERARLTGSAQNKLSTLRGLMEGQEDIHHTLVYCGDGTVEGTVDKTVKRQLDAVVKMLGRDLGLKVHPFTAEEGQDERQELLENFESGDLQALAAIRCLDEGVDVPATETAYILSSSTNPRQFVQRRGRILRPHENKESATIHDFIVVPPSAVNKDNLSASQFNMERNMVRKELERVAIFAENAINHPDSIPPNVPVESGGIRELKERFNLLDL